MKFKMLYGKDVLSRPSEQGLAADVVIVGAGLIGLAIALELHERGAAVTVLELGHSLAGASAAAAGMLAADDPHNPPELQRLARLSVERYPTFLRRIEVLAGCAVPFQTKTTIQYLTGNTEIRLAEQSIDPRQLAAALLRAVKATSIQVLEQTEIAAVRETTQGMNVHLSNGAQIASKAIVYAAGAWTAKLSHRLCGVEYAISPQKGQMLRVKLPPGLPLSEVHRGEHIYIVPRLYGPQAGTALIGATEEDAGFETTVRAEDLNRLRGLAAELLPQLKSEAEAPMVEAWAGLRPATPDSLPILGGCRRANHFVASGHYRNGILLAPATAIVMVDLVEGKIPEIDLSAFAPDRAFICVGEMTDPTAQLLR